jgi:hypothetical protein
MVVSNVDKIYLVFKDQEFREQFSEHVAICHHIPEERENFRIYVFQQALPGVCFGLTE